MICLMAKTSELTVLICGIVFFPQDQRVILQSSNVATNIGLVPRLAIPAV